MKIKVAATAVMALVLTLFNASTANATLTPTPFQVEDENTVVGFILKLKPGINHIAPNGEPTGENYAGVDLENSRLIGGGYSAVSFNDSLTPLEIEDAMSRLKEDPRIESVEPDQFVESASYVARPIAPMILGVNEPVELPIVIKTALRLPSVPTASAVDAWTSGTTERVTLSWTKPTGSYSGYIVGYRVQLYASGAWRTLKSQTYASTRSYTTTSGYLKAGTSTPFRVAALIRSSGKTYVGYYKKVYATPTTAPQNYPKFWLQNQLSNVSANWNLIKLASSRGGLPVTYSVQITDDAGGTITCEGITATQCTASNVVAGTRYTATLIVSNAHGTKSSPSISITYSTAPTVVASDDPDFAKQWYLKSSNNFSTNAESAWATETGHPSVIVAVLDTGITAHPDIPSSSLVSGYDMVSEASYAYDGNGRDSNPSDPGDYYGIDDSSWHGTHVAGIIAAADNDQGIVGVAPNVKIQPIRVLSSRGGTVSDITAGINWAIGVPVSGLPTNTNIASVLNLSIGGVGTCTQGSSTQVALAAAKAKGITVVTAAGNDNDFAYRSYPGNCYPTINVGATGSQGKPAFYSNFSDSQFGGVDISAPGGDYCVVGAAGQIYSTLNDGRFAPGNSNYEYAIGTSMAAPMVAGSVALIYSAKYRQDPNFDPTSAFVEEIWTAVSDTARPFSSSSPTTCGASQVQDGSSYGGYGPGIIDASAALAALLN